MKRIDTVKSIGAVALALAMAANLALAGAGNVGNPGVAPPQSSTHGQTYGAWAAAWWQWALSTPASINPLTDTTGQFAAVGQSGPVWFLAGVWGGSGTVVRECTVPPGKALLVPIVNWFDIGWGWTPDDNIPEIIQSFRDFLKSAVDQATDMACEIDGKPVRNIQAYREQSIEFTLTMPEDNLFGMPELAEVTDFLGVDDGYYLLIEPLKAGTHTIHFHAQVLPDIAPMDVTYHLTVAR